MRHKNLHVIVASILLVCVIALSACSQQAQEPKDEGPSYIDDQAMSIIAKGFEKRSDYLEKNGGDTRETLQAAVQTEIDNDAELKGALFEDTKMQEAVISYLNSLDDQMNVLNTNQYGSVSFNEEWAKAYDRRTAILKNMVDTYGLAVGDKYKSDFAELIANGTAVEKKNKADEAINGLIAGATWEKVDDGFGHFTYTAIVENTTEYDFESVSLIVSLYDADDVKTEAYANTQIWKKGDKVKFEAWGEVDAQRVEGNVQYYDIAE